jgi:hypothetical protein
MSLLALLRKGKSASPKNADEAPDDASFSLTARVTKLDEDQHLVYGWASVTEKDGQLVVDSQDDTITTDDLVKAAHDFVLSSRRSAEMHRDGSHIGDIVESLVFTPDVQKALGIDLGMVGWFIGVKVSDMGVWKRIKSGEYKAFSIGGTGVRVPL